MAAKLLASFACVIVATSAIAVPTSYAVGSLPVAKYAVPSLPIQKYAVPSLQVQKYAVPSLQVQKYAAPILAAAPVSKLAYAEPEAPAHYSFEYSVQDQHSGDVKQQKESRQGDAVQGYYSLVQPDGVQRIVEYTADKVHGFNAVVRYEGQPTPAPVTKVAYAHAPLAKVAYAPAPVQKLAYAPAPLAYSQGPAPLAYAPAPVAKLAYSYAAAPGPLAYAAPAKIAYSQNLGHVSFSSPSFSYQH